MAVAAAFGVVLALLFFAQLALGLFALALAAEPRGTPQPLPELLRLLHVRVHGLKKQMRKVSLRSAVLRACDTWQCRALERAGVSTQAVPIGSSHLFVARLQRCGREEIFSDDVAQIVRGP